MFGQAPKTKHLGVNVEKLQLAVSFRKSANVIANPCGETSVHLPADLST